MGAFHSAVTPLRLDLGRRSSLDEALERGGLWLDWPAGVAEPAPPVFWGEDVEPGLLAPHRARAPYPAVGLACIANAVVRDQAFLADASGRLFLSDMLFPAYINIWIERGERPKEPRPLSDLEEIALPGVSALVHHCNAGVYGHWLVEGLTKLLYLRALPRAPARIILHAGVQRHVVRWIEHVAPDLEVFTYDPATQHVRCEMLVAPTLACSPHYVFNPRLNALLQRIAPAGEPERLLYCVPPWRSSYHWMENEARVQELAEWMGFELYSPIRHPIHAQIEAFAGARVVAGDYGSALHNTLFSPPGTRVLCFNWVTPIQSRIAQLRGQRIGFQLGHTGAPAIKAGYTLDLNAAKRALEAALSV